MVEYRSEGSFMEFCKSFAAIMACGSVMGKVIYVISIVHELPQN
jgi:H+/gluconate symporter-like permease